MQIEFKVDHHPSGRFTLKMREQNSMTFSDCKGQLFGNADAGAFYKAVAQKLYEHHSKGDEIVYHDTNLA